MRVDQVVVSAAPGDAVTNSALEYRKLLREVGPSDIYAQHVDPALEGDIHRLSTFDTAERGPRTRDDLLVFHGSIGAPEVFSFLATRPERIVLVYHNVSPAAAYEPYDVAFAGLLESGRRDIAALAGRVDLALAPSAFNAAELVAMGYRDVRLSPLVIDVHRLLALHPDPFVAETLAAEDHPVLLYVGQVLPHKSPERLVQAFHALVTYLRPGARLLLVGATRSAPYRRRLEAFVGELGLPGVELVGPVSDHELAAYLRGADVFVTASSHEGFCVPLVEAMAFGLPVVARACGAVPETLAGAGVAVPEADGPLVFTEAIEATLADDALRNGLVAQGRDRAGDFEPDAARATFLRHILSVA